MSAIFEHRAAGPRAKPHPGWRRGLCLTVLAFCAVFFAAPARAACTAPAAEAGNIFYNSDYATYQFCDGGDWWDMKLGGAAAEIDPQVNTLNSGKWCTSDGAVVNCTANPPVTTESDPQVNTLTSGRWCKGTATVVNCTTVPPDTSDTNEIQTLSTVLSQGSNAGGQSAANFSTIALTGQIKLGNSAVACDAGNEGALRYNTASKVFEGCNGTAWARPSAALSLNDLTDVEITSPANGQMLVYEGASSLWKNAAAP